MKRLCLLLVSVCSLVLPGCVSSMMNTGLDALLNQPIDRAFEVIGFPTGKMELGENTVYTWDYNRSSVYLASTTANSTSWVGTTPVYTTTTIPQAVPMHLNGNVKILADKKGKIINWSWEGQMGALSNAASRLQGYATAKRKAEEAAAQAQAAAQSPATTQTSQKKKAS